MEGLGAEKLVLGRYSNHDGVKLTWNPYLGFLYAPVPMVLSIASVSWLYSQYSGADEGGYKIHIEDIFAQDLAHKTILSSLAWVVFVILLWGRMQFGWRGTTAIRWSLSGFTFLILAYFGSKFVLELIL